MRELTITATLTATLSFILILLSIQSSSAFLLHKDVRIEEAKGRVYVLCKALHNTYGFNCEGWEQCYRDAGVSADVKSRVVPTKVKVEHLRQYPPLPPCSYKWTSYHLSRQKELFFKVIRKIFECLESVC